MEKIDCPFCGTQINVGVETCPSCGKKLTGQDDADDPAVNNSEAIEAMLRSAAMLMKDSEEFTFDDEQENDEPEEAAENAPPEKAELTSEQRLELDKGKVVELSGMKDAGAPAKPISPGGEPEEEPAPEPELEEIAKPPAEEPAPEKPAAEEPDGKPAAEEPTPEEPAEEPAAQPESAAPAPEPEKPADGKNKKSALLFKGRKAPALKREKSSGGNRKQVIFACAVTAVMLILGFMAGFIVHSKFFSELTPTDDERFAQICAAAVTSGTGDEVDFAVISAYIRRGVNDDCCILYGGMKNGTDDLTAGWYRISYDKALDAYNVYMPLDADYYKALSESSDAQDRVLAAVLKNYSDTTASCVKAAGEADGGWIEVDMSAVNRYLIHLSEQNIEFTADQTENAEAASTDEAADLTDLT